MILTVIKEFSQTSLREKPTTIVPPVHDGVLIESVRREVGLLTYRPLSVCWGGGQRRNALCTGP